MVRELKTTFASHYTAEIGLEDVLNLDILRATDDGFLIAEKDLELRGGGDEAGHDLQSLLRVQSLTLKIGPAPGMYKRSFLD